MSRILKWKVPIDDDLHKIGSGKVVLVGMQTTNHEFVTVWTEETPLTEDCHVRAMVFGTGQDAPPTAIHLGSVIDKPFVWHVFQMTSVMLGAPNGVRE